VIFFTINTALKYILIPTSPGEEENQPPGQGLRHLLQRHFANFFLVVLLAAQQLWIWLYTQAKIVR
jgi:hypothetical protein